MSRKLIAVGICLALAGCGASTRARKAPVPVKAAGVADAASFVAQWQTALVPYGIALDYQAGSLDQLERGSVSLLFTDQVLPTSTLLTEGLLEFPVAATAVAVVYNVPGVPTQLNLSAATLHAIFSGTVDRWDAPQIAALNQGVPLPATPIRVIRRADPATDGSTIARYAGIAPRSGSPVTTELATARAVSQTQGSLGYVSLPYALQFKLAYAQLRTPAGTYVAPSIASSTATATRAQAFKKEPKDFAPPPSTTLPTSSSSTAAYPAIAAYYLVVHRDVCSTMSGAGTKRAKLTANVALFALGAGQALLERLDATPLPWQVDADAFTIAGALRCDGRKL